MIVCYIVGIVWKRTTPRRAAEIDLITGRKCWASIEELDVGRQAVREMAWPKYVCYAMFGVSTSVSWYGSLLET